MICERTDADTLVRSLRFVNKRFYDIISDTYRWKKRAMRTCNDCDIPFMMTENYNENTFNWMQYAWHTEVEDSCWSEYETKTTTTVFSGAHFSEVDAVLMAKDGNHCFSASRDRSICLWNTMDTVENPVPVVHKVDSHLGWVWDLGIYDDDHFLSCSWDSKVKLWNTSNFMPSAQPIHTFSTDAAVLSITSKENFIAAGLYTPKIIAFDPREPEKRLFELLHSHSRSIIDLCLIEDYYLVSMSEDKTVSIYDLRKNRTVKAMLLSIKSSRFPMCGSYYDNILFIGDNRDGMYWLDCSDGLFDVIEVVNLAKPINDNVRNYKLNCIKCTNYGSIMTGGNEGAVYILTPTNPAKVIAKIQHSTSSEITSIDYQNDTLVVGYVSSNVQVWKKK
ncbi:F-box/WD repeat-containing protein 9 isoform X2 [Acyrthosiphon pisum]|nr:F-box/WD repeat-containing protein 9 isoform X2 [Acyrthosiphon pisum]XP_029343106.1 F-box/WD repeat-containing protein 9 isoform X2 [Acyrthosiphon pisum]|eukprot:XP_008187735.1 PREDICTED: F-box/WD repeat-containing protein 9 isoform X2 [Acyrthosiphon pisum]